MYNDAGDFEIYISAKSPSIQYLKAGYYVVRDDDDRVGIIEDIVIKADEDDGDYFTVTGRFLESILDRRIIWNQTTFINKTAEYVIRQFVYENAVNPSLRKRRIDGFILGASNGWTDDVIDSIQRTGTNLLELVKELCQTYEYGFKVTLNDSNQFVFNLYRGIDRSYEQSVNPYVVFSNEFENLIPKEYTYSTRDYRNVALVSGEGEGLARRTLEVGDTGISGLDRREVNVDARDISSNKGEDDEIDDATYNGLLEARGKESLINTTQLFDADAVLGRTYTYKEDFNIGDKVVVEYPEWGISTNVRISGITENDGEDGYTLVPTLTS